MELLFIEQTELTPEVVLDSDNLEFSIKGNSVPDDSNAFYKPVFEWLDSFCTQFVATARPLSVEVKLKKYDQSSLDSLLKFFLIIGKLYKARLRVIIDWILVDDESSRQIGQDLSDDSGLPFNFVEDDY